MYIYIHILLRWQSNKILLSLKNINIQFFKKYSICFLKSVTLGFFCYIKSVVLDFQYNFYLLSAEY